MIAFYIHILKQLVHCVSASIATIGSIWSYVLFLRISITLEIIIIVISTFILTYFFVRGEKVFPLVFLMFFYPFFLSIQESLPILVFIPQ
jgi:hypothetical protein